MTVFIFMRHVFHVIDKPLIGFLKTLRISYTVTFCSDFAKMLTDSQLWYLPTYTFCHLQPYEKCGLNLRRFLFTKLASTQHNYTQISCTEFYHNSADECGSMGRNSTTLLSKISPIFTQR